MTLNELIAKLTAEASKHGTGEHKVTTWDGEVVGITFDLAKDGICTNVVDDANEISIELELD